jgi:tartrate dehydrogenase/decarboxylase / D-malate dehydrogenase
VQAVTTHRIAVIAGDGIGKEVMPEGVRVLETVARRFDIALTLDHFDWSCDNYDKHGWWMPPDWREKIGRHDCVYFGATGWPARIPDHVSLWDSLMKLRKGFDQYVNLRPVRLMPGIACPLANRKVGDIDYYVVRENTEGEYSGSGGRVHAGLPEEVATETSVFTRKGVERVQRFAFELAKSRPRRHLTLVTKSNAQRHGMVLWDEVFFELARGYPEVKTDRVLVDAVTTRMVLKPSALDTVVASNLHADILSDLAAALSGSLGIAPTANLNPERRFPSMFEPIHGSAFDITGKGIANPIATFWTASMMLEHLGEAKAAARLMKAIEAVTARKVFTPDLGGTARTVDVTAAVLEAL